MVIIIITLLLYAYTLIAEGLNISHILYRISEPRVGYNMTDNGGSVITLSLNKLNKSSKNLKVNVKNMSENRKGHSSSSLYINICKLVIYARI